MRIVLIGTFVLRGRLGSLTTTKVDVPTRRLPQIRRRQTELDQEGKHQTQRRSR